MEAADGQQTTVSFNWSFSPILILNFAPTLILFIGLLSNILKE